MSARQLHSVSNRYNFIGPPIILRLFVEYRVVV